MKKSIFLTLLLSLISLSSVSAGTDTDRICADQISEKWYTKWIVVSYRGSSIDVSYPGESVEIESVWREVPTGNYYTDPIRLFYVVNIIDEKRKPEVYGLPKKRAELYTYDCESKKPKLLLTLENTWMFDYSVTHVEGGIVTMTRGWEAGEISEILEQVTVFDSNLNKRIFTINNTNKEWKMLDKRGILLHNLPLPDSIHISGFVSGRNAWYLYFKIISPISQTWPALYSIDKKTKKITKL